MKKRSIVTITAALACLLFAACFNILGGTPARGDPWLADGEPITTPPDTPLRGTAPRGYNPSPVHVDVHLREGIIVYVELDISGESTTQLAVRSVERLLPSRIVAQNSFNVDGITRATGTVNAVKLAGRNAFITAGVDPADIDW